MSNQPDFSDSFKTSISSLSIATQLDRVERRVCASDNYDGAEYKFYGSYIPIRPIIDFMAEQDEFAIENMSFCNETGDPNLIIFVADMRQEQEHPAFTPEWLNTICK